MKASTALLAIFILGVLAAGQWSALSNPGLAEPSTTYPLWA